MARTKSNKAKKNIPVGVVFIYASFNNTIVTFTDPQGQVIDWSSAGRVGYKGSRKSTPFVATLVAQDAARRARDAGVQQASVVVRGPGAGRESALRALGTTGIRVTSIRDATAVPHNGCRPPKRRRV